MQNINVLHLIHKNTLNVIIFLKVIQILVIYIYINMNKVLKLN